MNISRYLPLHVKKISQLLRIFLDRGSHPGEPGGKTDAKGQELSGFSSVIPVLTSSQHQQV